MCGLQFVCDTSTLVLTHMRHTRAHAHTLASANHSAQIEETLKKKTFKHSCRAALHLPRLPPAAALRQGPLALDGWG